MRSVTYANVSAVFCAFVLACGGSAIGGGSESELEAACKGLCDIVQGCPNIITADVNLDDCYAEFCEEAEVLEKEVLLGDGTEACDGAAAAYIDCASGLSCPALNDSGIINLFTGTKAIGCEAEQTDLLNECIIN